MSKNKYLIILAAVIVGFFLFRQPSSPPSHQTSHHSHTRTAVQPTAPSSRKLINVKYRNSPVDLNSGHFEHHPTVSSFVNGLWYDQNNQYMIVLLNTTYYHYCGLPAAEWRSFKTADSYGTYYNQRIKGNYDCRRGYVPGY